MDITFSCTHCHQQLEVDASAAGSRIQCPSCSHPLTVPEPDVTNIHHLNPIASSAAAREEKHFTVPVHDAPSEVLIARPAPVEEVQAGDKKLRIKTIKRIDCVEVGKDRFEDHVGAFLAKIGEESVVSINTIYYTHVDMGTRQLLNDFGVLIVYRG